MTLLPFRCIHAAITFVRYVKMSEIGSWHVSAQSARKVSNGTAHAENFPPGPKTRHTYQAPETNKELKGQISLEPLLLLVFGEASLRTLLFVG